MVVAAIAAIALTSGSNGGGASSPIPSASGSAGASGGPVATGAPVITGAALPTFTATSGDPAIGQTIPTVEGANFAGAPVSIALDGKPKVILFLAHWCSHCQAEVPLMQAWLDAGGAPDGVELISVATGIDASLPELPARGVARARGLDRAGHRRSRPVPWRPPMACRPSRSGYS